MAVKIRLETDNSTKPGFSEAAASLQEMANKAGITTDAAKELNKALNKQHYAEFRAAVKAATDELDGSAAAKRRAKEAAEQLAQAERQVAEESRRLADSQRQAAQKAREAESSRQQSIQATVDAYQMLKDAAKFAFEQIQQGAAEGGENAKAMVDAFSELGPKLREVALEGETVGKLMRSLSGSGSASEGLVGFAREIDKAFADAQSGLEIVSINLMELLGQVDARSAELDRRRIVKENSGEGREEREREAAAQRFAEAEKRAAESVESVHADRFRRQQERQLEKEAMDVNNREIEVGLIQLIGEQEKKIRNLALAEGMAADERDADLRRAQAELRKLLDLQDRRKEKVEEAAREGEKIARETAEAQVRWEQERQRKLLEMERERIQKTEEWRDEAIRREQARKDAERRNLLDRVAGHGGLQQGQQLLESLDPRKLREAYAQRREAQGESRFKAFRDFNAGRADRGDFQAAQSEVADKQMRSIRGANQLGEQTISNMHAMVGKLQDSIADQDQLRQEMNQLQQVISNIGQNPRTRAQRSP